MINPKSRRVGACEALDHQEESMYRNGGIGIVGVIVIVVVILWLVGVIKV